MPIWDSRSYDHPIICSSTSLLAPSNGGHNVGENLQGGYDNMQTIRSESQTYRTITPWNSLFLITLAMKWQLSIPHSTHLSCWWKYAHAPLDYLKHLSTNTLTAMLRWRSNQRIGSQTRPCSYWYASNIGLHSYEHCGDTPKTKPEGWKKPENPCHCYDQGSLGWFDQYGDMPETKVEGRKSLGIHPL